MALYRTNIQCLRYVLCLERSWRYTGELFLQSYSDFLLGFRERSGRPAVCSRILRPHKGSVCCSLTSVARVPVFWVIGTWQCDFTGMAAEADSCAVGEDTAVPVQQSSLSAQRTYTPCAKSAVAF